MSAFDWKSFLQQWSQAILESMTEEQLAQLPPDVIATGWLGYPGATEQQLAQVEAQLRMPLPPSYREFLKVSNGWRQMTPFIHKLWSTEGIAYFASRHLQWIEAFIETHKSAYLNFAQAQELGDFWEPLSVSDDEYFTYGEEQDCSQIRVEYLKTAIAISDVGESAIYLLNPQVVTEQGEWEAWFFADWLPGADRYRSFQEMMVAEYQNFLELRDTPSEQAVEPSEPMPERETEDSPASPIAFLATEPDATSMTGPEVWRSLKRLTIEFQSRQRGDYREYRTIASAGPSYPSHTWSGLKLAKLQSWLRQELTQELPEELPQGLPQEVPGKRAELVQQGGSLHTIPIRPHPPAPSPKQGEGEPDQSPSTHLGEGFRVRADWYTNLRHRALVADHHPASLPSNAPAHKPKSAPERSHPISKSVLEIDQLEICQNNHPPVHIQVNSAKTQKSLAVSGFLISQLPFSMEVVFKLVGPPSPDPGIPSVTYKAQLYAQNRTTGQWAILGETQSGALKGDRQSYIAHLNGRALDPGLYRLQVFTTLHGAVTGLTSFELPLLNVV
ncbi:SMI1/KNR4 family protein [Leptodesmis sichuanensis]|uniref:SMI1/KNR4 family protein n=1 Tax=Leptodesmis sichuanensis TaxID=2906798 RepID=UPI001F241780|nr:SMI1/KNR4 family protein [Leptodesmis sichuanensis]UIE37551.1 SMI1/KNR4 family protein [Leptodesmis sichuanensis A121]